MTNSSDDTSALDVENVPYPVLEEAVQSVVKTLDIQVGLPLKVFNEPVDPRERNLGMGSSIALTTETGAWNLAVMADSESCNKLTAAFFAMEDDEKPTKEDIADSMGEIVNVAAGVFKASRSENGEKVLLGLPMFLEGGSCFEFFAKGIQGISQSVKGPDGIEAHVILIWQENYGAS